MLRQILQQVLDLETLIRQKKTNSHRVVIVPGYLYGDLVNLDCRSRFGLRLDKLLDDSNDYKLSWTRSSIQTNRILIHLEESKKYVMRLDTILNQIMPNKR